MILWLILCLILWWGSPHDRWHMGFQRTKGLPGNPSWSRCSYSFYEKKGMWKIQSIAKKGNGQEELPPMPFLDLDWGKILTQKLRTLRRRRYWANPHWWKNTKMCTLIPRLMEDRPTPVLISQEQALPEESSCVCPAFPLVPSGSQWPEGMRLCVLCQILKHFCMFIQFRVSAISFS